ncbi:MAG: FHA domain-containing protein, partial [Thermoguttaceae bacterium]
MPDLIAQGPEPQQRWRRTLPEGEAVVLGRQSGAWAAPWDGLISRRHARVCWNGRRLEVERLAEARNPLFLRGREVDRCTLKPGEHFVLGQTTFTLADQQVSVATDAPPPVQQQSFSAQYLKGVSFRNPDHRIEVLSRLPEVIAGAAGDHELFVRLVSMLLAGVPRADAAAVVAAEVESEEARVEDAGRLAPRVLHWDQRLAVAADFRPSQGLILESLRQGQSVLQVWRGADLPGNDAFTASETFDWAFCTPAPGRACRGWALYVAGRFAGGRATATPSIDPNDLREDVKFTELVAATLGSLREMRLLERRQATLSQFFSPVVLETLAVEDPELVLSPRETDVSVLFCDLRGFSRQSERQAGDLPGLL